MFNAVVFYFQPRPPGSPILTILKDQNFVNETIDLGKS